MSLSVGLALPNPRPAQKNEPLYLVHHHPGYVRVRADAFVDVEEEDVTLAAARDAAESAPGFRSWSHNPKTGSVVVRYDPERIAADDLIQRVADRAALRGVENATRRSADRRALVGSLIEGVQELNQIVAQVTDEKADLRELVPLALVITSAVSFVKNDDRGRLPQWSNALYHAYRIFMHWHRRDVRTREREARQKEEADAR
jgi:hypothetical protein